MAAPAPKRVALVVHPSRAVEEALTKLTAWATAHAVDVLQLDVADYVEPELAPPGVLAPDDLVVALGGDGTVLAALRLAAPYDTPVMGVACGSLGALSAVPADELGPALERVFGGKWSPRVISGLAVHAAGKHAEWAANDFVVVRRGPGQLVVELLVDGERYVRLAGDGLVVATPIGSSAYTMAAGGPLVAGGTPAFVCTPLAMHGGSAPPLVVPADATVTVALTPGFAGYDIEIDGHDRMLEGLRFDLTLHPDKFVLVSFAAMGRGLTGLRRRGLIADSPRLLARDKREREGIEKA